MREDADGTFALAQVKVRDHLGGEFVELGLGHADEVVAGIVLTQGIEIGDPIEQALLSNGFIGVVYPEGYEGVRTVRIAALEPVVEVLLYWPSENLLEPLSVENLGNGFVKVRLPDRSRQYVLGVSREAIS